MKENIQHTGQQFSKMNKKNKILYEKLFEQEKKVIELEG